jgi:hypothetical protein
MVILVEIGALMLMVDLLNLLFTSFRILDHGSCLLSVWFPCEDSLLFLQVLAQ